MRAIEMCAGAGGQALGLDQAGFSHEVLIENDSYACETLNHNNLSLDLGWGEIQEMDLKDFANTEADEYRGRIDLVAGGVPCPPFSKAGRQLGRRDDRDLFPTALEIVRKVNPYAVLLENVPGLLEKKFISYRENIIKELRELGYVGWWQLFHSSDFGVSQLRPRTILVAIQAEYSHLFSWPQPHEDRPPTVGEALSDLMVANGWEAAREWAELANRIAPTLVGGSKKHGGPDLGPTRAKQQWQSLHVNPHRLAGPSEVPGPGFKGVPLRNGELRPGFENMPLLTVRMAARLQGFPDYWEFMGSKTHAYRQVGNAFPPPVAFAIGSQLAEVIQEIRRQEEEAA